MRQSWSKIAAIAALALVAALLPAAGCDRPRGGATVTPTSAGIVSLTPAGTDLIVAMGLGERVVGVSGYEANETLRRKLPKVGDYLHIDFERVAALRPGFLVVQGKRDRLPAGVREKCIELNIRTIILQIDRLADIEAAVRQIGLATGETSAAARVVGDIERRQAALRGRAPATPVPALIVFSDSGTQVVGRETFIDDALTLAGGANVVAASGYVAIDVEKLRALRPRVVFLMLPGADAAVVARATAALAAAGLPAAAKLVPMTDLDTLMPGTAALRMAETMAGHLRAAS